MPVCRSNKTGWMAAALPFFRLAISLLNCFLLLFSVCFLCLTSPMQKQQTRWTRTKLSSDFVWFRQQLATSNLNGNSYALNIYVYNENKALHLILLHFLSLSLSRMCRMCFFFIISINTSLLAVFKNSSVLFQSLSLICFIQARLTQPSQWKGSAKAGINRHKQETNEMCVQFTHNTHILTCGVWK